MIDLTKLNDAQRQCVVHGDEPLLVLAGAGTGKTTAITYRVGHLMYERGVRPDKILALTFTNKAAREMRERSAQIAQVEPRLLSMGTFHSMCGRILRRFGEHLGLDANFVIYDQDDQLQLIKRCLADLNLDTQVYNPRAIRHRIEQWKNQGQVPQDVEPSAFDMTERKALEVYKHYRTRCLESNAVDFGDMILHTVNLIRRVDEVRETCHERWSHILVDEYQDTNPVQYQLLRALATKEHSLTVVGDDDQSIYRWRGADIGNILRFENDFEGARIIRLEKNYRSTAVILEAANAVIKNNASRKGKTLYTDGPRGDVINFAVFPSERDEADAIARGIDEHLEEGGAADDIGILYRTNAQSRALEDALRRLRIPYAVFGGVRFYDRKEIKDAMAYLRLLLNPRSDVDFFRIINVPARGIGKTSVTRMQAYAREESMPLMDAAVAIARGEGDFQSRLRTRLKAFVGIMAVVKSAGESTHPARLVERLLEESGYLSGLRAEGTDEAVDRVENLGELVAAIDEYVQVVPEATLQGFLEEVALASDVDAYEDGGEQVSLMTLHAAKGLEFRVVFMPGLEEGIFPHSRSMESRAELEEERRLCYVGLTRSKEQLHLSAARVRTVFGEARWNDLSRFVSEIPSELLEVAAQRSPAAVSPSSDHSRSQSYAQSYAQTTPDELPTYRVDDGEEGGDAFSPGARVTHATFGQGKVLRSEGRGKQRKLTVEFPEVGRKVIVARFVQPL